MQIIIPMSGTGDRFLRAGYKMPKPLIPVDGRPMIEHVIGMFGGEDDFLFICNKDHLASTDMEKILLKAAPHAKIVAAEPAKLGPVYAVLQAEKFIKSGTPAVVNYCDFSVKWDWQHFKRTVLENKWDGCISAYRGFHPHSLGDTYYAYMRVDARNRMLEIREKESFTSDRMEEFASAGTYYFSDGAHVKKYFRMLMDRKIQKNGEYYVSLAYNLMNEGGLSTYVYELEKFLQWGTPADLEEYQWWSDAFALKAQRQTTSLGEFSKKLQIVVPAAGAGERFAKEGHPQIKPLVEVSGKPMIVQALRDLPDAKRTVILSQKQHEKQLSEALSKHGVDAKIIGVDGLTEGQACTALLAAPFLDMSLPLLIAPCDTGFIWDAEKFSQMASDNSLACAVWAFHKYAPAARNPKAYGWLAVSDDEKVERVSCKAPVRQIPINDYGVCGAFYFRAASVFIEAANSMVRKNRRINNEFYIDESINELTEKGMGVSAFKVGGYLCWGTPNELKTYNYWQEYFDSVPSFEYKKSKDEDFL